MQRVSAAGHVEYSEEERQTIKELWAKGDSCSQIASFVSAAHGNLRTRNSVISLVHRMGLPGRDVAVRAHPKRSKQPHALRHTSNVLSAVGQENEDARVRDMNPLPVRGRRSRGSQSLLTGYDSGSAKHATEPVLKEVAEATSTQVSHLEATQAQCTWPASTDVRNMMVCGAPVTCGAYCDHHADLAYTTRPNRKRVQAFHRREEYYN